MKLTLISLFSGLAILLATTVSLHAEEPSTQVPQQQVPPQLQLHKMPMAMDCGTMPAIMAKLAPYQEIPFIFSNKSIMQVPMDPKGQLPPRVVTGETAMFMNPQTGSYSIVFKLPAEMAQNPMGIAACIIGSGQNLKPAQYEEDIKI